jgi:hypothetical protein
MTGQVLGSPCYMAPEQALGRVAEIDRRTDVYALGATLYELLAGVPPFSGASVGDVLLQVAEHDPVPLRRRNPRIPTVSRPSPCAACARSRAIVTRLGPCAVRRPGALTSTAGRSRRGAPARWRGCAGRIRRNKALAIAVASGLLAITGVAIGVPVAAAVEREPPRRGAALGRRARAGGGRATPTGRGSRAAAALALFAGGDRPEAEALWSQVARARGVGGARLRALQPGPRGRAGRTAIAAR